MEEWRDIKGYEGLYQVSNEGRVKSLNYHRQGVEQVLKLQITERGYKRVVLCDGVCKIYFVHRLVAEAFIPNPNNFPIINHKDENPSNNIAENLEWCDYKYNNTYNDRHVKCSNKISKSKQGKKMSEEAKKHMSESGKKKFENGFEIWNKGLPSNRRKCVTCYTMDGEKVATYDSIRGAALELGLNSGSICRCCKGERKSYKGFIWKYENYVQEISVSR